MNQNPILYLAGAWLERERLRLMRSLICAAGFGVRASWLDAASVESFDPAPAAEHFYAEQAETCLYEIRESRAVVVFESETISEGAAIEMGYALALPKPVFLVGRARSVFHTQVTICHGLSGLIVALFQRFRPTLIELPGEAWDGERYLVPASVYSKLRSEHHADCAAWAIGRPCDCVAAVRPFGKSK